MALFKIKKGVKANLPSTYTEGYCYFTTDDGKFYIDTTNTAAGRIILNAYQADLIKNGQLQGDIQLGDSPHSIILSTGSITGVYGYIHTDSYGSDYISSPTFTGTIPSLKIYGYTYTLPDPDESGKYNYDSITFTQNKNIIDCYRLKAEPRYQQTATSTTYKNYNMTYIEAQKLGLTSGSYVLRVKENGEITQNSNTVGNASTPVYINNGVFTTCTGIQTVGLTHIGAASPTSTNYVLWVDTDEADSLAMRADAIKYKTFSIATSAWSGSGPYTYQMSATGVTANTAILNLTLDTTSQAYQKAQLDWETGANFIKLSTATKPTGTISGYLIATEVTVI